jgi:uncharacterized protein YutE (UPF0331/DUF86 family)
MMVKDIDQIPSDHYNNYAILNQQRIISTDLHLKLKKLTGLRNRIVHDYNGLIDENMVNAIDKDNSTVTDFQEVVKEWIEKQ